MTVPDNVPFVMAVKVTPLLVWPLTVTVTGPVVTPVGAIALIVPVPQELILAARPLNFTTLDPCVLPKFDPAMATVVPAEPELGVSPFVLMLGPPVTVKVTPLLPCPATVTTTEPVVVPAGTGTMIDPGPQLKGVAAIPLKVIVLLPWGDPNPEPLTVTVVLIGPELGERVVMLGGGMTVKLAEVDCAPTFTVIATTPPAAPVGTGTPMLPSLQLVGVAAVPPKVTVLEPAA